MLVLIASPSRELDLNLNALKNSPHLLLKPEEEPASRRNDQAYLEQVQQTVRQHLAWFQKQVDAFKSKRRELQRQVLEQPQELAEQQPKTYSQPPEKNQIEM